MIRINSKNGYLIVNLEIKDPFKYTNTDLYELMKKIGDKRFGSECKHEKIKNGKCLNCFRKVITK